MYSCSLQQPHDDILPRFTFSVCRIVSGRAHTVRHVSISRDSKSASKDLNTSYK